MNIRCITAVRTAKIIAFICRRLGYQGETWAGKAALMICPDVVSRLSGQVREKIFVVCGTNGKTTTNNMLCAALEAEGKKVVCNHSGSNMENGVAAAFVLAAGTDGKLDADYACIEVDEACTRLIFPELNPDIMVLTNLFRDQLDRYGEIDHTMEILETMIKANPQMKLVLNGDDPLSVYLAIESGNAYVTYGINDPVPADHLSEIREGRFCKRCGERLVYRFYHFSQLGDYRCPSCGFCRPKAGYNAEAPEVGKEIAFSVEGRRLKAAYKGLYNVYNILAAYSAVREAGLSGEHFQEMLGAFHPENGRAEEFRICGAHVLLNLAKNPAGFDQNIAAVLQDERPKDVFIFINDNDQDGRDISWLWDVDFESLKDPSVRSITVGGIRKQDMRLRLKYADIPCTLSEDEQADIRKKAKEGSRNICLLVNYTALYKTRAFLKKLEAEET